MRNLSADFFFGKQTHDDLSRAVFAIGWCDQICLGAHFLAGICHSTAQSRKAEHSCVIESVSEGNHLFG